MSKLAWITDADLNWCIDRLRHRMDEAQEKVEKRIKSNVPDPFLVLCLAHIHGVKTEAELMNLQIITSVSAGISSAIGDFHQNVLGKIDGFTNHDAGYDIECSSLKILAEVKNKHNTMNASNSRKVLSDLETVLRSKPGFTGYLVIIVPKKPEKYKKAHAPRIFEIDGTSFYEMATRDKNALSDLYGVLAQSLCPDSPSILQHCTNLFDAGMAK